MTRLAWLPQIVPVLLAVVIIDVTPVAATTAEDPSCQSYFRPPIDTRQPEVLPLNIVVYFPLYLGLMQILRYEHRDKPTTYAWNEAYGSGITIPFDTRQILPGSTATPYDTQFLVRESVNRETGKTDRRYDSLTEGSILRTEMRAHTTYAVHRMVQDGVISESLGKQLLADEELLPIDRTVIIVYLNPKTGDPMAVLGISDGSRDPGFYPGYFMPDFYYPRVDSILVKSPAQIQLEKKTPLILPEREIEGQENRQDVFELLRLAVDERVGGGMDSLLCVAAQIIISKYGFRGEYPRRGGVYAISPGTREHLRLYVDRYRFSQTYTPGQLGAELEAEGLRGLRKDLFEFLHMFLRQIDPEMRDVAPRIPKRRRRDCRPP